MQNYRQKGFPYVNHGDYERMTMAKHGDHALPSLKPERPQSVIYNLGSQLGYARNMGSAIQQRLLDPAEFRSCPTVY